MSPSNIIHKKASDNKVPLSGLAYFKGENLNYKMVAMDNHQLTSG